MPQPKKPRILVKCTRCGEEFLKKESEILRRPHMQHYCSKKCFQPERSIEVKCTNCSNLVEVRPVDLKRYKHHFCSRECKAEYQKGKSWLNGGSRHWQRHYGEFAKAAKTAEQLKKQIRKKQKGES